MIEAMWKNTFNLCKYTVSSDKRSRDHLKHNNNSGSEIGIQREDPESKTAILPLPQSENGYPVQQSQETESESCLAL